MASHRAAAALWGLDGVDGYPVEISISGSRRLHGVTVHRRAKIDRPRTVLKEGIRTACIERTIVDLAGVVPKRRTGLALDDALRQGLTTLERVSEAADAVGRKGRSGMEALRKLLEMRDDEDAQTESGLETALLRLLRLHGLPTPSSQYRVRDDARTIARLDFAYPELRIGIEADGFRWHSGRERWAHDIRRENSLKLLGWTLLRFSREDVKERPETVAAQVRSALDGNLSGLPALFEGGVDRLR